MAQFRFNSRQLGLLHSILVDVGRTAMSVGYNKEVFETVNELRARLDYETEIDEDEVAIILESISEYLDMWEDDMLKHNKPQDATTVWVSENLTTFDSLKTKFQNETGIVEKGF